MCSCCRLDGSDASCTFSSCRRPDAGPNRLHALNKTRQKLPLCMTLVHTTIVMGDDRISAQSSAGPLKPSEACIGPSASPPWLGRRFLRWPWFRRPPPLPPPSPLKRPVRGLLSATVTYSNQYLVGRPSGSHRLVVWTWSNHTQLCPDATSHGQYATLVLQLLSGSYQPKQSNQDWHDMNT